jgi:hypothetical protein
MGGRHRAGDLEGGACPIGRNGQGIAARSAAGWQEVRMTGLRKIYVKCWRGSQLLETYEFTVPGSAASSPILPDRDTLIAEAQTALTNGRLAGPPPMESGLR